MFNNQVLAKITQHYSGLQIRYKNQSQLMKCVSRLPFFTSSFMTDCTTSIGNTIYFPNQSFVNTHPVTSLVVLLHETIHMYDEKRLTKPIFGCLYLLPQLLFLPALLLFLVASWMVVVPLLMLLLIPLPAPFRTIYEKRAYFASLYCMNALNKKHNYHIDLQAQSSYFLSQFTGPYYYYMWPFHDLDKEFAEALTAIQAGKRPFEDKVFDILDDILSVA